MSDKGIVLSLMLIVVALLVAGIWLVIEEQAEWDYFIRENHCEVVAETKSLVVTTFINGKIATSVIPGTTTVKCSDGKQYTR